MLARKLLCERTAPFERPVVPDVYTMAAASVPSIAVRTGSEDSAPAAACDLVHVPHQHVAREQARHRRGRHHGPRRGVGDDVGDFALAVEDVDGDDDHAELEAGEERVDEGDAVGQEDTQAVAAREPATGEKPCQPMAARIQVSKGEAGHAAARRVGLEADLVALTDQTGVEQVEQLHGAYSRLVRSDERCLARGGRRPCILAGK